MYFNCVRVFLCAKNEELRAILQVLHDVMECRSDHNICSRLVVTSQAHLYHSNLVKEVEPPNNKIDV